MFQTTFSTIFLAFLASFPHVARATHAEDVSWAVSILSDLPVTLATPFCETFVASYAPTAGVGGAGAGGATVTVTSTVAPESCGTVTPTPTPTSPTPVVVTAYSTTTITYITTSTILVAPTAPVTGGYKKRDTWCPNEGVPCRLAQYDYPTICEACEAFLGNSGAVTVTVTATATTCGTAPVEEPTGVYGGGYGSGYGGGYGSGYGDGYGDNGYDDIVPAFGDDWYDQAPYNSDENGGYYYGDY
ncbi:hypothetical protein P3342_000190 [Pyrenophora teres f. teres]|nr:hypothetical protein HRS9139_04691 [Pyrenophora teres f. teres]KAE8837435.1 hypothetical protein PTNB85_04770 [Pyrenophora teres f. teres]KAE8840144.1 hypothetical protein HRS9122_06749 [Pyrenophora teres f. teres]KAE8862261.1 hypothetical protein PTNB29_04823 [Pyrenophora teres f. teres]KAE8869497.1 hypothetical protein PTNB73_04550 [Pyrenophora teres f. teres]